jgi:hypothetical protein
MSEPGKDDMPVSRPPTPSVSVKYLKPALVVGIAVLLTTVGSRAETPAGAAGPAPVGLGTAAAFAVLGGSTVTNTGPTVLNGDLGLSPGTAITGFPPGTVNGTEHRTDAVAAQAQSDLTIAYDDAAGRAGGTTISADLGGQTLVAGVYTGADSLQLTGMLTLDGQGNENAVFIFRAPSSTLTTASASSVRLIGGAQACNIVWQIGSSATLGTNSSFTGNILALQSITATTGAHLDGSTLARNGAVTLDSNTITRAACAAPTTTSTAPGGGTATTVPGGGTATTIPGGGTATTIPGGGSTASTIPGGGTTTTTARRTTASTVPPGGTTSTTGPGGTTSTTGPGGGTTTDTIVRHPLASTGTGHGRAEAVTGLVLTGLGLSLLATRRRRVR